MSTVSTGQRAERAAAEYLEKAGFRVVEHNFKTPACEIDIIAKKGDCVYFVEVKYRATAGQGMGLDYITSQKQRHMQRAAEIWVAKSGWRGEISLAAIEVSGADFVAGEFIESIV